MDTQQLTSNIALTVKNIGGIDQTDVSFQPGVTVLTGRNATNRTSLLQGIMAVLGSDSVSIKADADRASVELEYAGETYTRTLERTNGAVQSSGNPYLEDTELADLFAFLIESNEARRAVLTDTDLRDIIMRPVDTEEIQSEIDRQLERRREVSTELEELEELKARLPSLEEKRRQLDQEIEETRADLAEAEAEIESQDADVEASQEEQAKIKAKLQELSETRSELDDVRYDLETERDGLDSLRTEKAELDQEYEEVAEVRADKIAELESRIEQLRTEKQQLESELNAVQSVIGFNQEQLEKDVEQLLDTVEDDRSDGSVTDDLLPDQTLTCWTCGTDVEAEQIEQTIDQLRELSQSLVSDINGKENELDALTGERRDLKRDRERRERLEDRRENLGRQIEDTRERIEELSERRDALGTEIEAIEAEVTKLESNSHETVLDLHKEANELEYELGSLENDRDRVAENIATIEDRLAEESELTDRYEEINEEIEGLRTRIDRIEKQAVEEFNEHMESVLDILEYDNLARIWLKRRKVEVREGRQKVTKSVFDLHVIRQTQGGATYEDTIENLSESEREVTGLVFALSGYLVHEVYDVVPFMLLDSVETIDAERIARVVDYLEGYSEFLVVALLPEDAAAIEDASRITDI